MLFRSPQAAYDPYECPNSYPSQNLDALGASTTGNIYGIYDMAGGVYEYVMGQVVESEDTPIGTFNPDSSSGEWNVIPETKYYDSYAYDTNELTHERGQLGDATKETLNSFGSSYGSWYGDFSLFPEANSIWFMRGGVFTSTSTTVGILGFNYATGFPMANHGFRSILVFE